MDAPAARMDGAGGNTGPRMALMRRYSCMYTPDLLKKGKTWHDGYVVFHHMNSKAVLFSDKFIELDDCFFRLPGLTSHRDIPKEVKLAEDLEVEFERHLATIQELVFEEEKDVSAIWQKQRKQVDALDSLADQNLPSSVSRSSVKKRTRDTDDCDSPAPPTSRFRENATGVSARHQPLFMPDTPDTPSSAPRGVFTTRPLLDGTNASSAKPSPIPFKLAGVRPNVGPTIVSTAVARSSATSKPGAFVFPGRVGVSSTPVNGVSASPRTTTPFKPPSFLGAASTSTPSSVPRSGGARVRALGTTRPSSLAAERSLQRDWVAFTESPAAKAQAVELAGVGRGGFSSGGGRGRGRGDGGRQAQGWADDGRDDERRRKRSEMLDRLQQMEAEQGQAEIVAVEHEPRNGQEGDTSSWMFD